MTEGRSEHMNKCEDERIVVENILRSREGSRKNLIPLLQDIQEALGYISPEAVRIIAETTGMTASYIFGVATFYAQFRFQRPGKYQIRICEGTACHVRGTQEIISEVKRRLNIEKGETTKDGLFSLETVACMGCCALAPVMMVNEDVYGECTPEKAGRIIEDYSMEAI